MEYQLIRPNDLGRFLKAGIAADGRLKIFYLISSSADQRDALIALIRGDAQAYDALIVTSAVISSGFGHINANAGGSIEAGQNNAMTLASLVDFEFPASANAEQALWQPLEVLAQRYSNMSDSLKGAMRGVVPELTARLSRYLWANPARYLSVAKDVQQPQAHHYPLLSLWQLPAVQQLPWLQSQQRQDIVQPQTLYTRIRSCAPCHSFLLNYTETCPACHSIDVHAERALHCFTCGHIDNEDVFQRHNRLVCPNCLTQLRHIGTDYDRPIENTRCHSCNNLSIDAHTQAVCLDCGARNEIDALKVFEFYDYRAGLGAEKIALKGELANTPLVELTRPLTLNDFSALCHWLGATVSAHDELEHWLVVVNFNTQQHADNIVDIQSVMASVLNHINFECLKNSSTYEVGADCYFYLVPSKNKKELKELEHALASINLTASAVEVPTTIHSLLLPILDSAELMRQWLQEKAASMLSTKEL